LGHLWHSSYWSSDLVAPKPVFLHQNDKSVGEARLPGEEKVLGVMAGIDAVGYEAVDFWGTGQPRANVVMEDLIELVNPTGHIGVIGVYVPQDPCAVDGAKRFGELQLGFGKLWSKAITVGTGQAPVARYNRHLRDLIIDGRPKPSFIVNQDLPLNAAPEAYQHFSNREPDYSEVILKPNQSMVH
jgi:glutathione-independent formaldehyde dehydrogenase